MNPPKSAWPLAIKYGIVISITSFVYSLILYITNLYQNKVLGWVGLVILLTGVILCVRERRDKDLGGYISFGQAFSAGFFCSLVAGVAGFFTSFLFFTYIAPDELIEITKTQQQAMVDRGMTADQIQQAMSYTKAFMTPVAFAVIGIIFVLIFGAILSLIVAAIMKKDNPNFPGTMSSAETVS